MEDFSKGLQVSAHQGEMGWVPYTASLQSVQLFELHAAYQAVYCGSSKQGWRSDGGPEIKISLSLGILFSLDVQPTKLYKYRYYEEGMIDFT